MTSMNPMNEPHDIDPTAHPTAALLPWYASGTLTPGERQEVERHLTDCAACRHELDDIRRLRAAVKDAYAAAPAPSADLLRTIRRRLPRPSAAPPREEPPVVGWFAPFWWRPWLPATLSAIIVMQFLAVAWLVSRQPSATQPQTEQIHSRSIPPAMVRIKVQFLERAAESDIRALLRALHGRIADGPLSGDVYLIEIPLTPDHPLDGTLHALRAKTELIRSAEPVLP
jgi:anti-sigma factor RsiW